MAEPLTPDPAPFDDMAFVSRLQKLLSMLGSEQPGEADAARRKLLEHLGHHRLSLTELGARLRAPPVSGYRPASFGGAEMGLERQLHLARTARQEAETDVQRARQRVSELSRSLQEAQIDSSRALSGQARLRVLALAGWLLAAGAGAAAWRQHAHPAADAAPRGGQGREALARPADQDDAQVPHALPDERDGTVLVQDLPVRLSPNDNGEVRAFLNRGTRVLIGRQVRVGPQTWLLIRTVTGSGWVRSGDVLH